MPCCRLTPRLLLGALAISVMATSGVIGGNADLQDFTVAGVTNHGVNALTVGGNLNQFRAQDGDKVFVGLIGFLGFNRRRYTA